MTNIVTDPQTPTPFYTLALNTLEPGISTITNINLYTDRAQITRSYKFEINAGTTKLSLEGLPNVMDHDAVRVEGKGNAMIQGVTAFKVPLPEVFEPSSAKLDELNDKKDSLLASLARYKKTITAIDKYIDNISIEHLDISKLGEAMDIYDTTEEKWEQRMREVGAEVDQVESEIKEEEARLTTAANEKVNKKLRTKVEMGLFKDGEEGGNVEIILIYAVSSASWEAGYDIRVDMQTPNAPVKVVYKAAINQRTGEAWTNVPLTLETAQPTFGLELPHLLPWTISHTKPSGRGFGGKGLGRGGAKRHRKILRDSDDEDYAMDVEVTEVTSKGKVNATFRVPGLVSVPSDEEEHGVVIAELELDAGVVWGCVPKGSKKVFLEANITNSSDYTFLPGSGNVYVDQSFISRSDIPPVSPKEVFKISLGVDPTIKVTYHPQEKSASELGFYNKSLKYTFTQRISIHNTKPIAIEGLRITDNIPVSQDAKLTVTLVDPALTLPATPVLAAVDKAKAKASAPSVNVAQGIVAMWNGTHDVGQGRDVGGLGKDGKIDWICAIPAFGRVNLVLQWEVSAGLKDEIFGLDI